MKTQKLLEEKRAASIIHVMKREELQRNADGRLFTEDEQRQWDEASNNIKSLQKEMGQLTERMLSEIKADGEKPMELGKDQRKDLQQFRLLDMIKMQMPGNSLNGIVRELHEEAKKEARELGIEIGGLALPSWAIRKQQRDIIAGTTGTGQYGVTTDVPAYITGLYAPLLLESVAGYRGDGTPIGASILRNLKGKIQMPVESTVTSGTWATEVANGTESTPTFAQATLDPKRVNTWIDVSKQLMYQFSDDIEMRLRNQIGHAIGKAVEDAAIEGGAANTPSGILTNIALTNATASGQIYQMGTASGAAPTWDMVTALEAKVENWSSMPALAYLTNPVTRGKFKSTPKVSGDARMIMEDTTLNGYPCGITSLVPSDLVKSFTGLSALIYGDWSYLYIGNWGGIDIVVDPYTQATNALMRIVVNSFWDVSVTNTSAFGVCRDIKTS